ncbi:MAG TPA: hypothetical protein VHR88_00235 [Solirubrobacteraceae bacterium]|jgi:hypothetical protein|nr:hypothetical protein [Solirubrobacteraceae bacterium]
MIRVLLLALVLAVAVAPAALGAEPTPGAAGTPFHGCAGSSTRTCTSLRAQAGA